MILAVNQLDYFSLVIDKVLSYLIFWCVIAQINKQGKVKAVSERRSWDESLHKAGADSCTDQTENVSVAWDLSTKRVWYAYSLDTGYDPNPAHTHGSERTTWCLLQNLRPKPDLKLHFYYVLHYRLACQAVSLSLFPLGIVDAWMQTIGTARERERPRTKTLPMAWTWPKSSYFVWALGTLLHIYYFPLGQLCCSFPWNSHLEVDVNVSVFTG